MTKPIQDIIDELGEIIKQEERLHKIANKQNLDMDGDNRPKIQDAIDALKAMQCQSWASMAQFPKDMPDGAVAVIVDAAQSSPQTYCRNFGAWFAEDDTEWHDDEFNENGYFVMLPPQLPLGKPE